MSRFSQFTSSSSITGDIAEFPSGINPEGYVELNGQVLKKCDYPDLYCVIGDQPPGFQSTTTLPVIDKKYAPSWFCCSRSSCLTALSKWGTDCIVSYGVFFDDNCTCGCLVVCWQDINGCNGTMATKLCSYTGSCMSNACLRQVSSSYSCDHDKRYIHFNVEDETCNCYWLGSFDFDNKQFLPNSLLHYYRCGCQPHFIDDSPILGFNCTSNGCFPKIGCYRPSSSDSSTFCVDIFCNIIPDECQGRLCYIYCSSRYGTVFYSGDSKTPSFGIFNSLNACEQCCCCYESHKMIFNFQTCVGRVDRFGCGQYDEYYENGNRFGGLIAQCGNICAFTIEKDDTTGLTASDSSPVEFQQEGLALDCWDPTLCIDKVTYLPRYNAWYMAARVTEQKFMGSDCCCECYQSYNKCIVVSGRDFPLKSNELNTPLYFCVGARVSGGFYDFRTSNCSYNLYGYNDIASDEFYVPKLTNFNTNISYYIKS